MTRPNFIDALIPVAKRRRATAARTMYRATGDLKLTWDSQRLLQTSTAAFQGWCTPHSTRWWEYPWVRHAVAARMGEITKSAADFGAGKSPIPIVLKEMGFDVTVVDPAQLEELEGKPRGNEWDFIDYSKWGISTLRMGMEDEIFAPGSLGLAVTVSVIEHVPAETRRRGLTRIAHALTTGGYVVLTVDLCRGTRLLWNRVVDELEPHSVHGTLDDLLDEARALNLYVEHLERCPIRTEQLEAVGLVLRKGS